MMIVPGSAFIPKAAGDPYWDNVVLLMHMDTTDFVDEKGHTVAKSNNPPVEVGVFDNAIRFVQSGGRMLTVTNSGTDFAFPAGDFTVEFRFKPYSYPVCGGFYLLYMNNYFAVRITDAGAITAGFYLSGYWYTKTSANGAITTNTDNAVAIVRHGTDILFFVNGILITTESTTGLNAYGSQGLLIGNSNDSGVCDSNAAMDELRITKGVARYTADFTVPSTPFPNS